MSNEIIKVEGITDSLKNLPTILVSHTDRATKAEAVAQNIIKAIEDNGGEVTEEIDTRANNFLANCSKAKKEMEESRKPVTQVMDSIKKMFTEQEGRLDPGKNPVIKSIQDARNTYARQLHEKQEQARKEAEERARVEKAKADARITMETMLKQAFDNALITKKSAINNTFNTMALDQFDAKAESLKKMAVVPSQAAVDKLVAEFKEVATLRAFGLSTADQLNIMKEVVDSFDLDSWQKDFSGQIQALKDELIDKLPSKKKQLEDMAKASEEEAAKIQEQIEEQKRQAEQKAAQEKAEAERKAQEEADRKKAAAEGEILFNQVADSTPTVNAPESRSSVVITVLHPAGWVEIFTAWFQKQGVAMDVESIGKTKLDSMKTFVEKLAKDEGFRIDSKNLKYDNDIKAVNRKK